MSYTHTHTGQENRESPPGPAARTTKDDDGCDACALRPLLCCSRGVTSRPSAAHRPTRLLNHLRAVCSLGFLPWSGSLLSPRCFTTFLPQHDGLSDSANKGSFHGDEVRNRFWSTCIFFFVCLFCCKVAETGPSRAVPCRVVSC